MYFQKTYLKLATAWMASSMSAFRFVYSYKTSKYRYILYSVTVTHQNIIMYIAFIFHNTLKALPHNYTLTCTCTLYMYLHVYDEAMNWELTLSGRFLESSLLDIGEIHRRWMTSLLRVSSWVTCPSPGTYLSPVTQ